MSLEYVEIFERNFICLVGHVCVAVLYFLEVLSYALHLQHNANGILYELDFSIEHIPG